MNMIGGLSKDKRTSNLESNHFTNIYHVVLCRYGVSGYPTLKFFPKGNKDGEDYDGGRDLDDFVAFINGKCGTSRDAKGQLNSNVGDIFSYLSFHLIG